MATTIELPIRRPASLGRSILAPVSLSGTSVDLGGCVAAPGGQPLPPRRGPLPVHPSRYTAAIVLFALVAAVALLTAVAVFGGAAGAAPAPERSGSHVVVGEGDTLLSIARGAVASSQRSAFVADMVALNGGDRSLEVGDVLALPVPT